MRLRLLPALVVFFVLGPSPLFPNVAQDDEIGAYLARGQELAKQGKPDQALPYLLLSLEMAESRSGAEDPSLLSILTTLAAAHAARQSYGDAEPLYERALKIQEREAARHQTGIVRTLNALGGIYEATGREAEAMTLYRNILTTWAAVLGGDHPDVRAAGGRLAKLALRAPGAAQPVSPAQPPPGPPAPTAPQAEPQLQPQPAPEIAEAPAKPDVEAAPAPAAPPTGIAEQVPKPAPKLVPKPVPKPRPKPTPAPKKVARTAPGYAVHLTSIRNPRDAQAEWRRLRILHGKLLEDLDLRVTKADLGQPRGIYYRIKGGTLPRQDAKARCASFLARGVWCGVTKDEGLSEEDLAAPARLAARDEAAVPKPPAVPETRVAAPDGFLIHLTSIRKPEDADAEWRRLKRLYGGLLSGLELTVRRADLGPGRGIYYRIAGGPLTRGKARQLCAEFSARKVWCRVVRPGEEAAEGPQRIALQKVRRRPRSRHRGTRRAHGVEFLRNRRRDPGCRRSPFSGTLT